MNGEEKVVVIEADREAYLSLNMLPEFDAIDVRAGRWDHVTGIQAFARHRQATLTQSAELVEVLCEALKPFAFAAEHALEIDKKPHDFVLTSEFEDARAALAQAEAARGR